MRCFNSASAQGKTRLLKRSVNRILTVKLQGAHFGSACSVIKMAASVCLEAILINLVQNSAEKDKKKPKKYVILSDIA